MLSELEIHAALPAQDLARAKQFYAEKLGLTPLSETPAALDYQCKDSWFSLYPSQGRRQSTRTRPV